MKRPLLAPALGFSAGILLAEFSTTQTWWFLAFASVGLAASFHRWRQVFPAWCLMFAGAGGLAYRATQLPLDEADLRWQLAGGAELGTVLGTLDESLGVRLTERQGELIERTVVRLKVEGWRPSDGEWRPASGFVAVSSKRVPDARFFRGQRVEITGVLGPPPGPAAPGLFDYRTFLRRQGLGLQLLCEAPADWALADGFETAPPPGERFLAWARGRLTAGLPDDEATRLILAMALGWRTALTDEVDDVFMHSGTIHVFAISGLHIALIATLLVQALRLCCVPRMWCGLLGIPLIWFYVGATGWQPSAIRSAVMTSVVVGTWALERPGDLLNSLSAAALAVLVWQPGQLFQAGFLLSFLVVAGLSVFQPVIEAWLLRYRPLKADELLPESQWTRGVRWREKAMRGSCKALATGLAALVASLPFTVSFFHLASPVSLLANIVVVPLSSLVLIANALSLCLPFVAELTNAAAWAGMSGMIAASRLAADLPGAWRYVASPSPAWWIPGAALLIAIPAGWLAAPERRKWWWTGACGYLVAIVIGLIVSNRRATVTVFRSGEAIRFDLPGGRHDLLLDCGDDSAAKGGVVPWLHSQGVNRLGTFAVSHGDIRHVGGAEFLFNDLRPAEVVLPVGRMRSPSFRRLDDLSVGQHTPVRYVRRGDGLANWSVLHPDGGDRFPKADDQSLALSSEINGYRFLVAPDLGKAGQQALCDRYGTTLAADVLITGVPRDDEAAGTRLLELVRPKLLIIGTGLKPAMDRTPRVTRRRLQRERFTTLFTEDTGAVEVSVTADGLETRDANGEILWRSDAK